MKTKLLNTLTAGLLFLMPNVNWAQAPDLGTAADFVLFTSVGAVTNNGTTYLTRLTGHVGTNSEPTITGFGNVDGQMHFAGDPASTQCDVDLLAAYNALGAAIPDSTIGVVIGNGDTLNAGIYLMPGAATLNLGLVLDAQGDANAVFIFKTSMAFATSADAKIYLINGAQACNVFWKIDGAVNMGAGTTMRGTIISGGAISMSVGDTLEGRALTINGAVLTENVFAYTPIGCGSAIITGPVAPDLASTACYALFSSIGPVTDDGQTFVNGGGDIGNNGGGLTTGFDPLKLSGDQHTGDGSTALCASDFTNVYNYLNGMSHDIELLYPAQFGHNLVLTPHTYLMAGAVSFTDTLYLNGGGNADAVFVIKINGAFSTSTFSKVILTNQTQAKNVYWKIDGALDINDYSVFNGTVISQGVINLKIGVELNGRALTGNGAISTFSMTVNTTPGCGVASAPHIVTGAANQTVCAGTATSFSVTAIGTNLTYQWRSGTSNLSNSGNISGATSAVLTFDPVTTSDAASNYNVVVSGSATPHVTSTNVSLVVNALPVITSEPNNQTACVGSSAIFSVTSTGTALTYQWRKGTLDLVDGANISGATSATFTINSVALSDIASNYNVVITGECSLVSTSNDVSLSLCGSTGIASFDVSNPAAFIYPNPFTTSITIVINDASKLDRIELRIYNILGAEMMNAVLAKQLTTIETNNLPSGIYFYKLVLSGAEGVIGNNKTIQSGRLIAQ